MTSTVDTARPGGTYRQGPEAVRQPPDPAGQGRPVGRGAARRWPVALRKQLNKVFPDHWSFMMGEIALYSFIILILTGTFLTFFFDASMAEVPYHGSYVPLDGVEMSRAYASTLHISFDVRGGLVMRQIHHWAALLFMASMTIHMFRVFFTGAFRKPRELNWLIGLGLITLGLVEGFAGYSLPDDLLSGTGLRIAEAIVQSIPVIGSWAAFLVFGGKFPGTEIIGRLYIVHVLLVPGILAGLIGAHMALLIKQKHTEFPGPGKTEATVSGERMYPTYGLKAGGFFFIVFAVCAALGGLAQINPVWLFGPYNPAQVSSGSQPDFYIGFLDGSTRLFPSWEIRLFHHTIPPLFWPTLVLPGILFTLAGVYPFLEAKLTGDQAPAQPAAASARRPGADRPGRDGDQLLRGAAAVRRQRPDRQGVRHLAERDDLGRPDRAAGAAAAVLRARLPGLHRPAAARPRGARARHRDRHHQAAAERRVHRDPPAARPGGRPRPRPAAVRRHAGAEEDEQARQPAWQRRIRGFFYPVREKADIEAELQALAAEQAERDRRELTD